jgi:hypothetical protein
MFTSVWFLPGKDFPHLRANAEVGGTSITIKALSAYFVEKW